MIPYPSRSWASNRKRCPPNLGILDVFFFDLHPTDSPSTKTKVSGLSHSFLGIFSRMMRLPSNSKRLVFFCEISYGLPQRLTGKHVFFVFFNDRPPWKKMWLLSRALKKHAGGSAGSAVTPRKMDIPSFLRPIFGATSSSTYLVSILFFGGLVFHEGKFQDYFCAPVWWINVMYMSCILYATYNEYIPIIERNQHIWS